MNRPCGCAANRLAKWRGSVDGRQAEQLVGIGAQQDPEGRRRRRAMPDAVGVEEELVVERAPARGRVHAVVLLVVHRVLEVVAPRGHRLALQPVDGEQHRSDAVLEARGRRVARTSSGSDGRGPARSCARPSDNGGACAAAGSSSLRARPSTSFPLHHGGTPRVAACRDCPGRLRKGLSAGCRHDPKSRKAANRPPREDSMR